MRFVEYHDMPNRYLCTVFDEMRKCCETLNFSYLKALIEEAQCIANKMESVLEDREDIKYYERKRKELKKEIATLEAKKEELATSE